MTTFALATLTQIIFLLKVGHLPDTWRFVLSKKNRKRMAANYSALLEELREQIEKMSTCPMKKSVFVGFDGFIDTVKKAVKQRQDRDAICFETLGEFSDRIRAAAGRSGQIEMLTERIKPGGNAPILGHALGRLGIKSRCLGSMGYPEKHALFSKLSDRCEVISVIDPGHSEAVEFTDGKMIFSDLDVFDRYDWAYIVKTIGLERVEKAVAGSDVIAFVDWANLPHAGNIWQGVLQDVIKPSRRKDYLFFFDLCDPSKKSTQEIDEVLDLMSCFSHYGKVTLGLNENEALRIWCALQGADYARHARDKTLPTVTQAGEVLFKAMRIDCLLVHPIDRTIAYHKNGVTEVLGRVVLHPKVQTGGGDNLNAGYCLGQLCGLSLVHCLLLGMAASGAYIENGESADLAAIDRYLRLWLAELPTHDERCPVVRAMGHGMNNLK
ncbi:hypothetical protein [Chryseolinea lacunae]|uniref:Carbohydrate kinase PfkB domain-containing protein n=1 Tax=Chryseolinea lacunae TaxID=2801331 RepID=A0ABS1KNK0_9BACT|nr:hypothetical protein [Chryseolinea lacunae]MBL0741040.1 hypothetical protein [Chryseolinea lacunae]